MNEAEARSFFNTLPVDERLKLIHDIISDIEQKLKLDEASSNLELFESGELPDLPMPANIGIIGHRSARIDGDVPVIDNIDQLRLADAVDHLRTLMKKYGYVQGMPSPQDLARMVRETEMAVRKKGRRTIWAEWVARDQATLDRPASHDWENWVTKEDEDSAAEKTSV